MENKYRKHVQHFSSYCDFDSIPKKMKYKVKNLIFHSLNLFLFLQKSKVKIKLEKNYI